MSDQEDVLKECSLRSNALDNVEVCGRWGAEIASLVISSRADNPKSKFTQGSKNNLVRASLAAFLLIVEFARIIYARSEYKKIVQSLSYEDFIKQFPHLVGLEQQILMIQSLIEMSVSKNLPTQILGTIQLVKLSLPYPYEKYIKKAARKLFKLSFSDDGKYQGSVIVQKKHPYKKFYKKVSSDFKQIVLKENKLISDIDELYLSPYAKEASCDYNNTLILMIEAGKKKDYDSLFQLKQKYNDGLIQRLYQYYVV